MTRKHVTRNRWLGYAWLSLLMLAVLPFLARRLGYQFLPSPVWISWVGVPAMALGIVNAVFMFRVWLDKAPEMGDFKFFAGLVFAPFFGYTIGSTPLQAGVPMVATMIAGVQVEMPFRVALYEGGSDLTCPRKLRIMDMPFFFDDLCGVSEDFAQSLEIGEQILIKGRGRTGLGIFPKSARAIH